jgi:NADH:ubiquinone oxidoreductase subunit E
MPDELPYLQKHVLICMAKSCGAQGGAELQEALKNELRARNLRHLYRDGQCSCMGLCLDGVNAVIWPEGTYLSGLTMKDIPRLVDYVEGKGPRLADLETRAREKIVIKKNEVKG